MKFKGKFLTGKSDFPETSYEVVQGVREVKSKAIIVRSLNPDYYLLLGSINLIITENGSELSHLAIVAKEQNVSIFLAEDIIKKINKKGKLAIKNEILEIN